VITRVSSNRSQCYILINLLLVVNENDQTLEAYNQKTEAYVGATPRVVSGDVKIWLDKSLSLAKSGGKILEIGSAFGRDAAYIKNKGFDITASDGSKKFVELMQKNGLEAKLINAITDELGGPYDLIYANAVLLHFTIQQTEEVLDKFRKALKKRGILSMRLKKGKGSEWSSDKINAPRFFQYWQAGELITLIEKHGFDLIELTRGSSQSNDFKWLQVIARKG
jgi:SAM-dependent methyltransferase